MQEAGNNGLKSVHSNDIHSITMSTSLAHMFYEYCYTSSAACT